MPGQRCRVKPKVIDASYNRFKFIQLYRFAEIAIRLKLVTLDNIFHCAGSRQDDRRNGFQARIILDDAENFAAVHLR